MKVSELTKLLSGYYPEAEVVLSDDMPITGVDSYLVDKTDTDGRRYSERIIVISDSPELDKANKD